MRQRAKHKVANYSRASGTFKAQPGTTRFIEFDKRGAQSTDFARVFCEKGPTKLVLQTLGAACARRPEGQPRVLSFPFAFRAFFGCGVEEEASVGVSFSLAHSARQIDSRRSLSTTPHSFRISIKLFTRA